MNQVIDTPHPLPAIDAGLCAALREAEQNLSQSKPERESAEASTDSGFDLRRERLTDWAYLNF